MRRTSLLLLLPLISGLVAVETKPPADLCSRDVPRRVDLLLGDAAKFVWINCSLYTPTFDLYQRCPSSMLSCFAAEVRVLTDEWKREGNKTYSFKLHISLNKMASHLNETAGACPRCEWLHEQNAQRFLTRLKETTEQIHSQFCSPP